MADRRSARARSSAGAPYDLNRPENWTVEKLREELRKNNVSFRQSDKNSVLLKKVKDLTSSRSRVDHEERPVQLASGSSNRNGFQDGGDHRQLMQTISTLTETVSKLQDELRIVSSKVHSDQATSSDAVDTGRLIAQEQQRPGDDHHNGFTLQSALRNPSQSVEGRSSFLQKTKFGYAIESLPFVETVSPSIRKAIIEGKDVNLAQLLIPTTNAISLRDKETKYGEEKPVKDPRLYRSLSISEFIYAFGIYKNIMCQTYPQRREELDLYERDIVDMSNRYGGKGFYEYHKTFSARAAAHLKYLNIPVDWSVRDNTLFCNIFANLRPSACYICNSISHTAGFCPMTTSKNNSTIRTQRKGQESDSQGRPRVAYQDREICNNFNSFKGCENARCGNAHVCLRCQGDHSVKKCNDSKNGQTPRSKH